jgi:hypothetical protein
VCFPAVSWLPLQPNDLFPWKNAKEKSALTVDGLFAFVGMWFIRLIKRTVQFTSQLAFAVLTICFAFSPICGELWNVHCVFFAFLLAFIVQEMQQAHLDFFLWRSNVYNLLDTAILVLLSVAVILRVLLIERAWPVAASLIDYINMQYDYTLRIQEFDVIEQRYRGPDLGKLGYGGNDEMCGWSWKSEAFRTLVSISLIATFVRLTEVFTFHSELGVLMVCTVRMIQRMMYWLPLVVCWSFGFAFAINLMAPKFQLEGSPGPFNPVPGISLDLSASGPFWSPFWALYGFFEPASIAEAEGSAALTPLLFWSYLLFSLILLTNLLIAMFNDTYTKINDHADEEWKMSRVVKVKTYMKQYVVPPPLNLIFLGWDILFNAIMVLRLRVEQKGGVWYERLLAPVRWSQRFSAAVGEKMGAPAAAGLKRSTSGSAFIKKSRALKQNTRRRLGMKNDQPVHAIRCAALPPSSGNPIVVKCIMLLPCNGTSQYSSRRV